MKKITAFCSAVALSLLIACGGGGEKKTDTTSSAGTSNPESMVNTSKYDPKRGEGKWNDENVKLGAVDAAMAGEGKKVFDVKCASCHKTTDEKLVGPGWSGVTTRHSAPWIMNFITNPEPMIDKDPELQAQLEICLVRMPNQSLTDDDARKLLEFMRQNDAK